MFSIWYTPKYDHLYLYSELRAPVNAVGPVNKGRITYIAMMMYMIFLMYPWNITLNFFVLIMKYTLIETSCAI